MARGSKKKYTSKQKRKAHDIEKGYKKRGVSSKEAERRAWATVNKSDKGGRKKGEEVAGKSEANQVPAKVEEKAVEGRPHDTTDCDRIIRKRIGNFILIWPVSFVQPWLPLCRERCGSFSVDAQSFSFAVQLRLLS